MSSNFQDYLTRLRTKRYDATKDRIEFQNAQIACNNWQSCLNCARFYEPLQKCLFYDAVIPARVIATGCNEYNSDIPF